MSLKINLDKTQWWKKVYKDWLLHEKKIEKHPPNLEKTGLGQTAVFELWNIKDDFQSRTELSLSWLPQKRRIFLKPRFPTLSIYFVYDLFQENMWLMGNYNKWCRWQAKIIFHCRTVQEQTQSYRVFFNFEYYSGLILLSLQIKVLYHFKVVSDKVSLSDFITLKA